VYSRTERIVNLFSAILVLIAGFYAIFFIPMRISTGLRIFLGILIIIYFFFRIRYYLRRVRSENNKEVVDKDDHNKILDKSGN
jgi:pilus assembly protein TadC